MAALEGVTKRYGGVTALDRVTFRLWPGEVFGLLGPNGAGKSTAVKILLGLVHATEGTATLDGRPSRDHRARRSVGYLPELFRFQPWMTGRQLLRFHSELAGIDIDEEAIQSTLHEVGMADGADRTIRTYSKGMSQRIGLAQAMLGNPRLVILDEPTSALDPVGRREVRTVIARLRRRGVAVILNSHLLGEVEQVCDRVTILDRGRVRFAGSLGDLVGRNQTVEVTVDTVDGRLIRHLQTIGEVAVVDDTRVIVSVHDASEADAVARAVHDAGRRLLALVPSQPSLEDVFVSMVEGGDR